MTCGKCFYVVKVMIWILVKLPTASFFFCFCGFRCARIFCPRIPELRRKNKTYYYLKYVEKIDFGILYLNFFLPSGTFTINAA